MPSHSDRVRRAGLPEGYQFGDAGLGSFDAIPVIYCEGCGTLAGHGREGIRLLTCWRCATRWRRPSENAAERLTSAAYRITQAQIAAKRVPYRHQWWCGGKDPCACTDGWKATERERLTATD